MAGPSTVVEPDSATEQETDTPRNWHVILLNDDVHTFEFVIELAKRIFGKSQADAVELTLEIHNAGRGIAATCHKERAELYCDQVAGMREGSKGPIGCVMEPAD